MEKEYNTLDYYNKNAKLYFEQTVEGDLKENYNKFLSRIPSGSYILDFGCGSGRDSKYFIENRIKFKILNQRNLILILLNNFLVLQSFNFPHHSSSFNH